MARSFDEIWELKKKYNQAVKSRDGGEKGKLIGELAATLGITIDDFGPKSFRILDKKIEEEAEKTALARNQQYIIDNGFAPDLKVTHGVNRDLMVLTRVNSETGRVTAQYVDGPKEGKKINTTAISFFKVAEEVETKTE